MKLPIYLLLAKGSSKWFLAWLICFVGGADALFETTLSLTRGIGPPDLTAQLQDLDNNCGELLSPNRTIVFSHPMSLDTRDSFYSLGSLSYDGIAMTMDYVNLERCGVVINDTHYSLVLRTLGDNSNEQKHEAIGEHFVGTTDFFLGGYSSSLQRFIAPIADREKTIMVTGGSSLTSIYEEHEYAYTVLPPGASSFDTPMRALSARGAKTVLTLTEEGAWSCGFSVETAARYGVEYIMDIPVPFRPTVEELTVIAQNVSKLDPDVVVTCIFFECPEWIQAMRNVGWVPRAQVFTTCSDNELRNPDTGAPATDLPYMIYLSSWSHFMQTPPDVITGWDPATFRDAFEKITGKSPAYQHVAAAASLSVLLQAVEQSQSLDSETVRQTLSAGTWDTMYGPVTFDQNGQNDAIPLLLQYGIGFDLAVVFPENARREGLDILYPIPTWGNRDCVMSSDCPFNFTCTFDGYCDCSKSLTEFEGNLVSLGKGGTARCRAEPIEDYGFVPDEWIYLGIGMVGIQVLLSVMCILWTMRYKNHRIVKASQPFFLILIAVGCIFLALSILPTSKQGGYRYERNSTTWEFTDTEASDLFFLDASCMAFPWLSGLGFALVWAALFAKIWRVQVLTMRSRGFRRVQVRVQDVLYIAVVMLAVETTVLLTWQLVSPLRWERSILETDDDGLAVKSVGTCESDQSLAFYLAWGCLNGTCLIVALWLAYLTRNVSDDFAEGKWITASIGLIFQVLLLAVPVLNIADANSAAFYILRAAVVFFMSFAVTAFIFIPKMWRVHTKKGEHLHVRNTRESSRTAEEVYRRAPAWSSNSAMAPTGRYGLHSMPRTTATSMPSVMSRDVSHISISLEEQFPSRKSSEGEPLSRRNSSEGGTFPFPRRKSSEGEQLPRRHSSEGRTFSFPRRKSSEGEKLPRRNSTEGGMFSFSRRKSSEGETISKTKSYRVDLSMRKSASCPSIEVPTESDNMKQVLPETFQGEHDIPDVDPEAVHVQQESRIPPSVNLDGNASMKDPVDVTVSPMNIQRAM